MAKDLSGTNILVQKEQSSYRPCWLVTLNRDHPERGTSALRWCSWTNRYTIGGNTYTDRLQSLGDLRLTVNPSGGLASVSDWFLRVINPLGPGNGRLSDMLEDYYLENDDIQLQLVFRTGIETSGDILTIFEGAVQDPTVTTEILELFCKDGTRATLKPIPQEVADFVRFPNMPLDNVNRPLPLVIGSMNTEPFNTSGSRPILAPCINTNLFTNEYSPGLLCKTYGNLYTFYRTAKMWAKVTSITQTGAFVTIDSSARYTQIRPIRPASGNDVTGWEVVLNGDQSDGVTVGNGDNLDFQMRGAPVLGTITAITLEIQATTATFDYTLTKTGESNISDTGVTGDQSIDISGWDNTAWDFEQMEVQIDVTVAGTIDDIYLAVTFDERETGDQLAFPIFQAVTGYQDVASQYQDGSAIVSANQLLEHPVHVTQLLMRDKRTGMRISTDELHLTNLAAEVAKTSAWKFAFSMTEQLDVNDFGGLAEAGALRLFRNYDAKWKTSIFQATDAPVYAFLDATNIAVINPEPGDGENLRSSLRLFQTPMSEIYNEFQVRYGFDYALGDFTEALIASPHYLLTGTGTLDPNAQTFTDSSATFQTDSVQVGYKVVVVRDTTYTITSVDSETQLSITPTAAGDDVGNRTDTYYLGPNTRMECVRSNLRYKTIRRKTITLPHVQDTTTAQAILDRQIERFSSRRFMATFRTWMNACHIELTDLVLLDHGDLPPNKRPVQIGTLNGAATKAAGTLDMNGTGGLFARTGDYYVLRPADGGLEREVVTATAVDEDTQIVTVTRAFAGSISRAWPAGTIVDRIITKWEVIEIRPLPDSWEFEITVRETPRSYSPIGHAAPDATPNYADATAEQRLLYGFAVYANGEASWLDEDSANSYARDTV